MTNIDQFESVFRAAAKSRFHHRAIELRKVLVVTDLSADANEEFCTGVRQFLASAQCATEADFASVAGVEARTTGELLERVHREAPDLVCTYRNLFTDGWKWPHSLGETLDLLTQQAEAPVIVLPHPEAQRAAEHAMLNTNKVMAVTDHVVGDERLVNWAVAMTESGGELFLAHVEDEANFERYMQVIGRIPAIDTEQARELIQARLVKEAHDYIESCREGLAADATKVRVTEVVQVGHSVSDYRMLIENHEIDILVLNTRDEDQLAMHGLAYPIAVEIRQIPLLML